jgi:hypothetical protein
VAGVKFIRVRVHVHVDIRTGKADGKGGTSDQSAARYIRVADALADVSAMAVAGEDSLFVTLTLHSLQRPENTCHAIRKRRGCTTLEYQVALI